MSGTTILAANTAAAINASHRLAQKHADEALLHAKACGDALARVKAAMPHGTWLTWLAANVEFSPRQAQRYMAAAAGRLPAQRSEVAEMAKAIKCDTVSHSRQWAPLPGVVMVASAGDWYIAVEPSAEHPGHSFVSALRSVGHDDAEGVWLTRPIRDDHAGAVVRLVTGVDPAALSWSSAPSGGVFAALVSREGIGQ